MSMPNLRAAFRTTVSGEGRYEMVFKFPSMDALHKADDEWRALSSRPDAGEAVAWMYTMPGHVEFHKGRVQQLPEGVEETPLYAHPAVAGEGLAKAVQRFLADYDDGDRADAGNNPLMEAHVADFRQALSQPAADADGTGREAAAQAIAKILGIDIYEQCSGDVGEACNSSTCPGALTEDHDVDEHRERIYRMADAALAAALSTQPRQPDDAVREYRELIAYNIIQGSAGIRAAEHAKDFKTGNWTDALHSADAVISTLVAIGAAQDELRKAVEGIDDDYMTSEAHHPGYVLIPTAKFEQIVGALSSTKSPDADGGAK